VAYYATLGGIMPKCLDCGNTKTFTYMENSYNEAEYDEAGELIDVIYKEFHEIEEATCKECESTSIEGEL
jgi:RNase P subunit RPR2